MSEQSLPEVNEDFFKSFGVEEGGMEAFREEVSNNMQREMKTASRNKLKTTLMDALISDLEVAIPAALMSNEIHQLKHQTVQQMGGVRGLTLTVCQTTFFGSRPNAGSLWDLFWVR